MQTLITAVRDTGANNLIMLGGPNYANDVSKLLEYLPSDPANNIASSIHVYNFNYCVTEDCWERSYASIASTIPVIAGEIGESDNSGEFVTSLVHWLKEKNIHYLAWDWGDSQPKLISDYSGACLEGYNKLNTRTHTHTHIYIYIHNVYFIIFLLGMDALFKNYLLKHIHPPLL